MHYIYTITNSNSGKIYIGRTSDAKRRKWSHFSSLKRNVHPNPHLQSAYNKYGKDALVFEVVDSADESAIQAKESEWFAKYDYDKNKLYNCHFQTTGGSGVEKRDETRKYIFDILDERFESNVGYIALAKKHKTSTTTLLYYIPEWEMLRGKKMLKSNQVEETMLRMQKFVDAFKSEGRSAYRRLDDFGLSYQSVVKHLPKFSMTFDDVRLDDKFRTASMRAKNAISEVFGGMSIGNACKQNDISISTYYKYQSAIA